MWAQKHNAPDNQEIKIKKNKNKTKILSALLFCELLKMERRRERQPGHRLLMRQFWAPYWNHLEALSRFVQTGVWNYPIVSYPNQSPVLRISREGKEKKKKALNCTIWSVTRPDKTPPPLPANRPLNDKEIMVILKQTALLLSVSNYFCHIVMKHWKWCNLQKYWGILTF